MNYVVRPCLDEPRALACGGAGTTVTAAGSAVFDDTLARAGVAEAGALRVLESWTEADRWFATLTPAC
jgi:hypothetical protein